MEDEEAVCRVAAGLKLLRGGRMRRDGSPAAPKASLMEPAASPIGAVDAPTCADSRTEGWKQVDGSAGVVGRAASKIAGESVGYS